MRILFVIESLAIGGAEKSLVTLLNNLNLPHSRIDLLLFSAESAFEKYLPAHVNIIRVFPKYGMGRRFNFFIRRKTTRKKQTHNIFWDVFADELASLAKQYDTAVAYGQGFPTYFVAEKVKAARKFAWVNTDYTKSGHEMSADYRFYEKFHKIVAVSPEVKSGLDAELQKIKRGHRVEVIKDITDEKLIAEMANEKPAFRMDDSKLKIVTVCRLVQLKGLDLVINAAKILKDKKIDFNWYIIGEGEQRNYLQGLVARSGLDKQVHLPGEHANPYPYMKDCDIYVQSSLFEGLGLTVIEAASLNKPIVSTNFPTVYGILKDNETGLIAEMNAESIAGKIEQLHGNPQLRKTLVSNLQSQKKGDKEEAIFKVEQLLKN